MEQTENIQKTSQQRQRIRPVFLTVIGIISFVGIGLGILNSTYKYFTIEKNAAVMSMFDQLNDGSNDPMIDNLVHNLISKVKNQKTYFLLNILFNIFCLIGVLLMWRLKKIGFFIYTIAEIAIPILSVYLIGNLFAGTFLAFLGTIGNVLIFVFPIAFIAMYAVNLKHMS